MDTEIKATPDAGSQEIEKGGWVYFLEGQSDLESLENKETLATTQKTHIEVTSDAGSHRSDISRIHFESSSHSESMESGESMEIEETLAAAEQTKIKATSDADALRINGTSAAAEQTEIKVTSDADAVLNEMTSASAEHAVASALYNYISDGIPFLQSPDSEVPTVYEEIGLPSGESSPADHIHFRSASDSEFMESGDEETLAAAEQTKIKETSDAYALWIREISAAAEQTEIEVTSDADAMRNERTSAAAEHMVASAVYNYIFDGIPFLQSLEIEGTSGAGFLQIEGTSAAANQTEIEVISDADALRIEGTSAAAEHTERVERTQWPTNSIFLAPAHIKNYHKKVFEPKLVSIGPYYHGQRNLQQMECLKPTCIPGIQMEAGISLCRRSTYNVPDEPSWKGEINIPLDIFREGRKARAYYKEEFNHSDDDFVRILFVDSCFIIRTILSLSRLVQESMDFLDVNIKDIRSDLLILENQIPLFFIRKVYDWFPVISNKSFPRFNTVLEPFICLDMPWTINPVAMIFSEQAAHLLDLYWRCSLSPAMFTKLSEPESDLSECKIDLSDMEKHGSEQKQPSWAEIHLSNNASKVIANATELNKMAGIEFKNFKDTGFHVNFSEGIIWMPRLKIDTRQKNLLINLIAFENCILPSMRTFSCYMKLMDALIDSANDVMLLQNCGVIYNTLKSHEMAAAFFNDIGNYCLTDYNRNHYSGFYKDVQKYYDSSCRRRWANLCQNYFSSPWSGISLFAAGFLLILSVVQTFYALYGYYKPMN